MKLSDYIFSKLVTSNIDTVFLVTGGGAMHLNDSIARTPGINFVCNHKSSDLNALKPFIHSTFNSIDAAYYMQSLKNIYWIMGGLPKKGDKFLFKKKFILLLIKIYCTYFMRNTTIFKGNFLLVFFARLEIFNLFGTKSTNTTE